MVFQQYSLFPNMTVRQNVAFGLQMQKKDKHFIAEKVNDVLHTVGLSDKLDQYPRQLSGGQQQRVPWPCHYSWNQKFFFWMSL